MQCLQAQSECTEQQDYSLGHYLGVLYEARDDILQCLRQARVLRSHDVL